MRVAAASRGSSSGEEGEERLLLSLWLWLSPPPLSSFSSFSFSSPFALAAPARIAASRASARSLNPSSPLCSSSLSERSPLRGGSLASGGKKQEEEEEEEVEEEGEEEERRRGKMTPQPPLSLATCFRFGFYRPLFRCV